MDQENETSLESVPSADKGGKTGLYEGSGALYASPKTWGVIFLSAPPRVTLGLHLINSRESS